MEKKHTDIESFFRKNLSDLELSKKEGNWELLNHLLNEQDRKNKNRRWLLFMICFLIILTSGIIILLPERKSEKNTNRYIEQPNISTQNKSNSLKKISDKSTETILSNKAKIKEYQKINVEKIQFENSSSISEEKNTNHNKIVNNEETHRNLDHKGTSEHSIIIRPEFSLIAQQANILLNDSDKSVEQTKRSESIGTTLSQALDSANANAPAAQTINPNLISLDTLITKSTSKDSLQKIVQNYLPTDSTASKQLIPPKTTLLNIGFYAGTNIYGTSSAFTNYENISPVVGLEFTHSFSSNLIIGLAGLYSLQGGYHLGDTAVVSEETYFLDKQVTVAEQTIQIHYLYKLYFPLTLYYSVTKRHFVLSAIQLAYLLNTKGDFTESNKTSGVTTTSQKINVKGYMDGIKPTNFGVSIGYQYKMSRAFYVSARITREITEAYSKDYFYGVNIKPSWTFQTFLIVKL